MCGKEKWKTILLHVVELEDFLKSRIAREASDAAPRRHGGLLLGLLANADDDDIFDEEVGENGDGGGVRRYRWK